MIKPSFVQLCLTRNFIAYKTTKQDQKRNIKIEEIKMQKVKTEIYSRVSGYFRPVQQWNKAKQEEFSDRKTANVNKIMEDFSIAQSNIKNRL
jgi:hypothetical protein